MTNLFDRDHRDHRAHRHDDHPAVSDLILGAISA
jgi:hypothetical protein